MRKSIWMPALLACLTPAAFGADRWFLTTGDFKSEPLIVAKIDDKEVAGPDQARIPLNTVVQLTRVVKIEPPVGLVLCVAGGDRLVGQPLRIDGADLVWFAAGVGEVAIPIERAKGILRDRTTTIDLDAQRGSDEIYLLNGDSVKGIITAASEKSVSITPPGGNAVEVPLENVRDILMATPPQGRAEAKPMAFLLRLANSAVVSADALRLNDEKIDFIASGNRKASVPTSFVAAIEHNAGPIAWLSAREPAETVYTPFFEGRFTPLMDRTVTGAPIRFGNQNIQRGIGMHSKTRMTFNLQPGDKNFRSRYAIDPILGYANVDVRVYLDDKVMHETKGFKAGDVSPLVDLPLKGAKTLTLEVDYGAGYDIQDRLNWIEPAILRGQD
jgi:hypothetical protein